MKKKSLFILILVGCIFSSGTILAQFKGGNGTGSLVVSVSDLMLGNRFLISGNWVAGSNWSSGAMPVSSESVFIHATADINTQISIEDLIISGDGNINISPAGTLTVNNSIENNGSLTIESDQTGTGSLIHHTVGITANVQRYIAGHNGMANRGWHYLSSPVIDQPISPEFADITAFPMSAAQDLYKWSEPLDLWINIKDLNGNYNMGPANTNWFNETDPVFESGIGYLTAYLENKTKNFSGLLNVQDLNKTITNTSSGWHLIGNPFASAVNWNDGHWNLINIDANCQVWKEASSSYVVVKPNSLLPAMNGFMVHVNSSTVDGSLTIPNVSRTHSAGWYKHGEKEEIQLMLTANDPQGETSQETIICFNPSATEHYDKDYDSHFLPGYAPMFYSSGSEEIYALNTMPQLSNDLRIPLGFVKNNSYEFTIQLAENFSGLKVYLTDLKTNETHLVSEHEVTFTSEEGDDPNRFVLHFGPVGVEESAETNPIDIWISGQTIFVYHAESGLTLNIYDLQGRRLLSSTLQETNTSVQLNLPSGLYLVTAGNTTNFYSTKIIVAQ